MRFPQDVPVLTDGTIVLRAHGPQDVTDCLEQCQDPVSQQWTTVPVPYTREDAEEFVGTIVPKGWGQGRWAFAVEAPDEEGVRRFCGTVELRDEGEDRAEIAYGSHPWARGRGIMEAALRLLLDWGFGERGVRTMIWWANRGNWASRRLAWRLGFSMDGTLRRWLPQRGELLDAWVGVLLADDARSPRTPWLDVPRIVGRHVVLRAPEERDDAAVVEACSDERTAHWLAHMPSPYTVDDARSFREQTMERQIAGTAIRWSAADPETDTVLGNISLFDIKPGREAEIGYWTHPAARGRGLMSESCALVVRHAFVDEDDGGLGLRRLILFAAVDNVASRHVAESVGFVRIGTERHGTELRDGSLTDTACYDLLREEWLLSRADDQSGPRGAPNNR
ncbi:MAG TPA: GNAT family N-acetyltransferase [Nocardioidaceae bacterium]|nr:GNAT family N-acetyltransferase [Nocardioidaceae bacterium]